MIGLQFFKGIGLHRTVKLNLTPKSRNVGQIINGTQLADNILIQIKEKVERWVMYKSPPSLTVLLIGDNPSSTLYVSNKKKAAQYAGIKTETLHFPSTISENELKDTVEKLNQDLGVDGILIQLPVPEHISKITVSQVISPDKDVDGFTYLNFGKFCLNSESIIPCTALAVAHLIDSIGISLTGKNVVVCGRSKHVGLPIALLLQSSNSQHLEYNATTTICHEHTPPEVLSSFTKNADVIISATGKPQLIRGDMVKEGAIVIDVGITRYFNEKLQKFQVVGDVCFEEVKEIAGYITPVPGGVGPLTVAMLMKNTFLATERQRG